MQESKLVQLGLAAIKLAFIRQLAPVVGKFLVTPHYACLIHIDRLLACLQPGDTVSFIVED